MKKHYHSEIQLKNPHLDLVFVFGGFQNQEKSRKPLQNPNRLGISKEKLEILKLKKIDKSSFLKIS